MPCFHRRKAWRVGGSVIFKEPSEGKARELLLLPCGGCIGCRQARARDWMVRCGLELSFHKRACWITLTYDDANLPPTLSKKHLSAFVKRLRAALSERDRRFRFFGAGEYGDKYGRPHYHVILFGCSQDDEALIVAAWGMGRVQVDRLEPAAIAYVAGYTAKKIGDSRPVSVAIGEFEVLDRTTGEIVRGSYRNVMYQPPFLLMSRKPGIGGDARKWWRSWRKSAIWDGAEVRVPRFLHEAFKKRASPEELAALLVEKDAYLASLPLDAKSREKDGEKIAAAKYNLKLSQRGKL